MDNQHEATIAAALALPEADRYRLWFLLGKQFDAELDFTPVYPESEWPAASVQKSVVHGSRKNFLIDLAQE